MANIIKIPCGQYQGQNLLPFSDINHIKTYCTPHNFTYSMNSDHEWGEYTPNSPSWATTNYWMNENLVPVDSPYLSLSSIDDGTTIRLHWYSFNSSITDEGRATIKHPAVQSSRELTYFIVGKRISDSDINYAVLSLTEEQVTGDYPHDPDDFFYVHLFNYNPNNKSEIGVKYSYGWDTSQFGKKYIQSDSNRNYHVFAFKTKLVNGDCPGTLNIDGTLDSFQIPLSAFGSTSFFPAGGHSQWYSAWDIKLIAVLDVAESDEVISNNVNILRMIYQ